MVRGARLLKRCGAALVSFRARQQWRKGAVLAAALTITLLYLQTGGHDVRRQGSEQDLPSEQDITSHDPMPAGELGFVVWTPSCRIPDLDPWDKAVAGFLHPAPPIKCGEWPPLTYTLRLHEGAAGPAFVLRVDRGLVAKYVPEGHDLTCCYAPVTRFTVPDCNNYTRTADNHYNISSCVDFVNEVKLKPEEEFILVRCSSYEKEDRNKTQEVYANIHAVVPMKQNVSQKTDERNSLSHDDRLNVLLFGYDSISRLNLIRTMPRTVEFLKRMGYIDLLGYNKVASNTRPNLMAILTGLSMDQLKNGCFPNTSTKFDDCRFLWKEFHEQGYVTAYGEDEPWMGTFNYLSTGFVKQPTDYYLRPYMNAGYKTLKTQSYHDLTVCMGPESTTDHMLSYITNFVITFKNYLYFSVFWLNNFSHNDASDPTAMDSRTLQFFNELTSTGTCNNTVIIFFSDHGMRYGRIRNTYSGWLEERLPFIYIGLPPWFKHKYPKAFRNLLTNRNRLTSPYDLHVTLKDILYARFDDISSRWNVSLGCPNCRSIFAQDVGDRACEVAGISEEWCACTKFKDIPVNDTTVQGATEYAVGEVQKILHSSNGTEQCANLSVINIHKASQSIRENGSNAEHEEYVIVFETLPGGAVFESTVMRKDSDNSSFSLVGNVNRINRYANQSYCVDNAELKLYCFCLPTSVQQGPAT